MNKDREHPTLLEQFQMSEEQFSQSINTSLTMAEVEEFFRIYQKRYGPKQAGQLLLDLLRGVSPLYHQTLLENARRNHQSTNNS